MAGQLATSIDCCFGADFSDFCLPALVSAGVIGYIHRLRSGFPFASFSTNRPGEVLDLFLGPNPTDQPELATAGLDSILLALSATTGQMVVIVAIHPLATTGLPIFTRTAAISRFALRYALVASLDAVPNNLGAVSHQPDAPLPKSGL